MSSKDREGNVYRNSAHTAKARSHKAQWRFLPFINFFFNLLRNSGSQNNNKKKQNALVDLTDTRFSRSRRSENNCIAHAADCDTLRSQWHTQFTQLQYKIK